MNFSKKYTYILLIAAAQLLMTACDPNRVFDAYQSLPDTGWQYNNVLNFGVPIDNTTQKHNIYINIRHRGSYEYNNLYVVLKMKKPDGSTEASRLNLRLADKQGNWLGNGTGSLYDLRIPLKTNYVFQKKGTYTFTIEQYMRINQLKNISDAGIRVEKSME